MGYLRHCLALMDPRAHAAVAKQHAEVGAALCVYENRVSNLKSLSSICVWIFEQFTLYFHKHMLRWVHGPLNVEGMA